jgi:phosphopantothenoylcysteine decarboxylase/phosphopantothenate--cysteine ligase
MSSSKKKILFQLSGSIAAYKACAAISQLVQKGYEVQTMATPSALQFVGPATLEGLTGRQVLTELFQSGQMMGHIDWANWADITVLCPASANLMGRMASGIADDLISTTFLAHNRQKPYLVFPAMNSKMLLHPATQNNLNKLQSWGIEVMPTGTGTLACGEVGEGKLLEPEQIVEKVVERVSPLPSNKGRILITAGGTRIPLDGVRYLTNFSSGSTGSFLAETLQKSGFQVDLIRAHSAVAPHPEARCQQMTYETFEELEKLLQSQLSTQNYIGVIHAAAVSDFTLDRVTDSAGHSYSNQKKWPSGQKLQLHLKPTPKLVSALKNWSKNPHIQVIAFKLTNTPDPFQRDEAIQKLLKESTPDWVIANDLSEVKDTQHKFRLVTHKGTVAQGSNKLEMAQIISQLLSPSSLSPNPQPFPHSGKSEVTL